MADQPYNPEAPTSDVDTVRLLISDVDTTDPLFDNGEIGRFLSLSRGPKRAAALALTVIAANEALLTKVITTRQLTVDGAKLARELRELAADLRAQADAADDVDDTDGAFLIVDRRDCPPELAETPRW